MDKSTTLHRFEHKTKKHGMWYNANAEYCPATSWAAKIPMDDDADCRKDGLEWFSAAKSFENLSEWFTYGQMQELYDLGFGLYEIQASQVILKDTHALFTKESVILQKEVMLNEMGGC